VASIQERNFKTGKKFQDINAFCRKWLYNYQQKALMAALSRFESFFESFLDLRIGSDRPTPKPNSEAQLREKPVPTYSVLVGWNG
jgi:hypothetical protein